MSVNVGLIASAAQGSAADRTGGYFSADGGLLAGQYPYVNAQFREAAKRYDKDLSWLDPAASLEARRAAAVSRGWQIGGIYCRCSSSMQDSYEGQMERCIDRAAQENIAIFPELVAGDEATSGRKGNRPGLAVLREWIKAKAIGVLISFSSTRWFRRLHKGRKFVIEDVMESGVRFIALAENIDSADPNFNRLALHVNMMMGEMQSNALPDFVRMGQRPIIENGFLVGACPLGYRPEAVPEAGLTKKGTAKTKAVVVQEIAALIRKHFELLANGLTVSEGCRLWNREIRNWPGELRRLARDPRSQSGEMRPEAYRRIFVRESYRGIWLHGVRRNRWVDSKDATIQVPAPEHEIIRQTREELRIVPDELWFKVQKRFSEEKRGSHGPRSGKDPSLGDLLTGIFFCGGCGHVFYQYGRQYMNCRNSRLDKCGSWGTVHRDMAVRKLAEALRDQILARPELVEEIVRQSQTLDAAEKAENLGERMAGLEKEIKRHNALMAQLEGSCSEDGMDADDLSRHKRAKTEKTRLQAELAALKSRQDKVRPPITPEQVKDILNSFDVLLADAGAGKLEAEGKQRAAALVRSLAGGRVEVYFRRLKNRRRAFGFGRFRLHLVPALAGQVDVNPGLSLELPEIEVEFRELPRYARIADEVHRLYDGGMSMSEIGRKFNCGSGNAWGAYAYWHEERGLETPINREGMRDRRAKTA